MEIAAVASQLLAAKQMMATAGIVGLKASTDAEKQVAEMVQALTASGPRGQNVNLLV